MYRYLASLTLLIILVVAVSGWNIRPLRAGTLAISDLQIRQYKSFSKKIDLQLDREYYKKWKDINVIASITELSMDQQLNFYFDYSIICPTTNCVLNFTFVRKTQKVNLNFEYSLTIDYLVARGLRIVDLNMTSYQEHIMMRDVFTFDQNNQPERLGDRRPVNNRDAFRMLLFPNGWSNMTRTGRVMNLYAMGSDMEMYVIHYMEDQYISGNNEGNSMGWPQGKQYIKYKVAIFEYDYLPDGCKLEEKWTLYDNYRGQCATETDKIDWFYGFKRTRETTFKGEFQETDSGIAFHVKKVPAYYGVLAFPFTKTDNFIDLRTYKHKYSFLSHLSPLSFVLLAILGLNLIAFVVYLIYVRLTKGKYKDNTKPEEYNEVETSMTPKTEVTMSQDKI